MYLNDQLGDCTCAAIGNQIRTWTVADEHSEVDIPDAAVLTAYEAVSGYNPTTGQNDNGAVELDVLNYWRKTGVGGHKIAAYAAVKLADQNEIKTAIELFGGVYIGVNLPTTAQQENAAGKVWDAHSGPDGEPGSWGGHAVPVIAYGPDGLACVTWGATQQLTWAFWTKYVEEAYAVLPALDWTGSSGTSPDGFDLAHLQADLSAL